MKKIGHITIPEMERVDSRDFFQVDVGHQHSFIFSEEPYLPVQIASVDNLTRKMFLMTYQKKLETILMYGQLLQDLTVGQFLLNLDNQNDNCGPLLSTVPEIMHLVSFQGIGIPQIPMSANKQNIFFVRGKTGQICFVKVFWENGWCFVTEIYHKDLNLNKDSFVFLPVFERF
ncbi:MAG TPA: hypothetical protein PJ997_01245 [Candidatus Paceibacterota bacterium]|nr:hypothetical protein [Candidatus Paceibacterota bacterium]HMP18949.1 hypothetical protein [Candidatus Paceibacterota bacterium]HMP85442.1 hypothetical protein [Candidatus Paceibacterota bacterium]